MSTPSPALMIAAAAALLLGSCRKETETPTPAASKVTKAQPAMDKIYQGARAYFEEEARTAAPEGTILPTVGKVRTVSPGDKTTSYVWQAVYEVDPADERVRRALEQARADGRKLDAGDAGAALYAEQVDATGVQTTNYGTGFGYTIQDGKLQVLVRPDDDFHKDDPNGFTISVGVPGG